MLSVEVRELAAKMKQLSVEDRQWLLQQLIQQMSSDEDSNLSQPNLLVTHKQIKTFNITTAVQGSGYQDTVINHDQVLADSILSE